MVTVSGRCPLCAPHVAWTRAKVRGKAEWNVNKQVTKIEFSHNFFVRTGGNRSFEEFRTDSLLEACSQFEEWQSRGGLVSLRRSPDGLLIAEAQGGTVREPDLREKVAQGEIQVSEEVRTLSHKTLRAPRFLAVEKGAVVREIFDEV